MKSRRGLLAAIIFLTGLPVAVLGQMIFGLDAEMLLHFLYAAGFLLISLAVFDFKIARWINLTACLATAALAFIFLLQGVSPLLQNDSLTYFAFQISGQWLEAWLVRLLLLWFAALLWFDSRGKTRILGVIVMAAILCTEIYGFYLSFIGSSLNQQPAILKLFYLPPFVWLLFESKAVVDRGR
jgi:hypothetical protein